MDKELKYTGSDKVIQVGDRVIIEFNYPENLKYVGRADKVLKQIIKENDGIIRKADQ